MRNSPIIITTKEEGNNLISHLTILHRSAVYNLEVSKMAKNIPMYVEMMQQVENLENELNIKRDLVEKIPDPILH